MLFSAVIRALAWMGIGYVGNDVYDYVSAAKAQNQPVTTTGTTQVAKQSLSNWFTGITKWIILAVIAAVATIYLLPKLFKTLKLK